MLTKLFYRTAAAALLLAIFAVAASAQVMSITGKVTLKQADGTEVPVKDAVVDIYRVDINQKFNTKTNSKGIYIHAGIPLTGIYTVTVSAPGARPSYASNLRFSQEPINFTLTPGDGARLSLDDVKKFDASGGGPKSPAAVAAGESKEDKAKREEMARKIAEVEASNAKITESNETVSRLFKAGNEALTAKRYEEAITSYREGLAARPDEPALLTNMSEALRQRGVERFNTALKAADANAKVQGMEAAKKDWSEAASLAAKAVGIIKGSTATASDPSQQSAQTQNRLAAITTHALAMRLVATKVDQSQAQAALAANQELIDAEIDPTRKAKLRVETLQMLLDSGATQLAVSESQKLLAESPDNTDANRVAGLALFASGDKTKYQEAANYLQRFVDKAPDTDPLKVSAKEALDYLKTAENVKPQAAPARTGRRRQ
ncbi:MAG TPA: carboxypeptidase-like regulatory domain-containing protein [Pyrinomonadaceae bacterium]|jgi:tetratricopeptide (TPR) repeat protein|nr:carboxypeptidase-like regulatory domain-containing protein [Pyrinomonadaceae bacterium]